MVLTTVDPETGTLTYKAQFPDEEIPFMPLLQPDTSSVAVSAMSFMTSFSDELDHHQLVKILEFTGAGNERAS
jgi:hypothetical protein